MWKFAAGLLALTVEATAYLHIPQLHTRQRLAPSPSRRATPEAPVPSPSALFGSTVSPAPSHIPTQNYAPLQPVTYEQDQVDWWREWWPMCFTDDLDPKVPSKLELLGRKYVIWADGDKNWHCFHDVCPHRLAPLSEGRIDERGNLQCAYHGWSFSGQGQCVNIPQAEADIKGTAEHAGRACAKAVPVLIAQGMVWVWPDNSPAGIDASRSKQPLTIPELYDRAYIKGAWVTRDLEYGWDTLIENVVDPAHVPFAHHGVQAQRGMATPLNVSVRHIGKDGVFLNLPRLANSTIDFLAPHRLVYKFDFTGFFSKVPLMKAYFNVEKKIRGLPSAMKPHSLLVTYAIPRGPGKSRILALFPRNFFAINKPRWLDHLERNAVLDGDLVFLHGQERELREPQYKYTENIDRAFFMPTRSDEGVRAFRHWLQKFGGGQPRWAPGVDPRLPPDMGHDRHFLMDRYSQHTVKCSACSGALRNVRAVKKVSGLLAVFAATAVWARPARLPLILGGGLLCTVLTSAMHSLERRFLYTDYVHARK